MAPHSPSTAVILHPKLQRPPLPPHTASFDDVPLDVLRLISAELAATGSARDVAAFESVCTATRHVVEDAVCWRRLVARAFPSARLPAGAEACPRSPTTAAAPTATTTTSPRPTWKRLYQFHHTLLYRCLVRGGSPSAGRGPTVTRLAPGALFVALPLGQLAAV